MADRHVCRKGPAFLYGLKTGGLSQIDQSDSAQTKNNANDFERLIFS